jgi:hypothetical protein
MPIRKFRSIEEMNRNQPLWREPGDPMLYRAIAFVWETARRTNPREFQPGVHKFHSIDEMNRAQDAWLSEHIQELRRRHDRK